MRRLQLEPQALRREAPGGIAGQGEGIGDRCAEQGIAQCGKHEPKRRLAHVMLFVADAELGDQSADGFEDRVEGVAVARQDHPGGERSGTLTVERVERAVDDFTRFSLSCACAADGFGDASGHAIGDRPGKLRLQSRGRAEVVKQIGVRAPDLRRHGLERDGLRTLFEEEETRGLQSDGTALFGVQAFTAY